MAGNEIKKTDATYRELKSIELIAALDARLANDQKYLTERLRSVPDLYRQWRIAQVATEKVIDGIYSTLMPDTLLRMRRSYENGEIVIRPKSTLNNRTDSTVVLTQDLTKLVAAALKSECAMCIKTGVEARKCKLRDTLLRTSPPHEISKDRNFLCEYANPWID